MGALTQTLTYTRLENRLELFSDYSGVKAPMGFLSYPCISLDTNNRPPLKLKNPIGALKEKKMSTCRSCGKSGLEIYGKHILGFWHCNICLYEKAEKYFKIMDIYESSKNSPCAYYCEGCCDIDNSQNCDYFLITEILEND